MVQRLVGAVGVAVALLAGATGLLNGQTAPVLPATSLSVEPGLALSIESVADPSSSDIRRARLVALYVPAGTAPAAYVPPGAFKAIWRGNINLRIPGQYVFSAEGTGAIKVTVNGQVVLNTDGPKLSDNGPAAPIKLKRGVNPLVAEYATPRGGGDVFVRLQWSEKQRPPEPLSPVLFSFDAAEPAYRSATERRAGRSLFVELRCLNCHQADDPALPDGAMPELAADAPSLANVGDRLNAAWMAQWIADPRSLRADATMPKVFHEAAQEKARDIADFLATLNTGHAAGGPAPVVDDATVGAGGRLFTGLGCINCHVPPDQEPPAPPQPVDAVVRVPLKYVNAKYKPGALRTFLKAPHAHYASTGMPVFQLSDAEADQLVAFLTTRAPVNAITAGAGGGGNPERGKALLLSSGCLNCHAAGDALKSTAQVPPLTALQQSNWSRGCLAADHPARGAAPNFDLDENERASLAAFAASDWAALGRNSAIEFADRQVRSLNCTACHTLDQESDAWAARTADIVAYEATLPPMTEQERLDTMRLAPDQSRPLLTWVGEKLRPQWMERFLDGQVKYKPRPWLRARMPAFHAQSNALAAGLAQQHGYPPVTADPPAPDPVLAAIGRTLAGKDGGFSCNQCHAIGSAEAMAGFEAPAPNFAHISDRLNRSFYDRWMFNPQRINPGTRMPQFADGEGKTSIAQPFDAQASKQFDALWQYILTGSDIQPPK